MMIIPDGSFVISFNYQMQSNMMYIIFKYYLIEYLLVGYFRMVRVCCGVIQRLEKGCERVK